MKVTCDYCKGTGSFQDPIGGSDHVVCWKCAGATYLLDNTLTPNDIYKLHYQETSHSPSLLCGCYYNHLEGSGIEPTDVQFKSQDSPRLMIRIVKYFDFDGRRFWRLATVWFDFKPIMIIQNAGREGDDWSERFITDNQGFIDMANHIRMLIIQDTPTVSVSNDIVEADQPLGRNLIEFYGNELDGYFRRYGSYI